MSVQALQGTNQEIHIKRLKVETINDKPFTLLSGSPVTLNLQALLTDGNDATSMSIKNLQNLDVVNLDVININSTPFNPLSPVAQKTPYTAFFAGAFFKSHIKAELWGIFYIFLAHRVRLAVAINFAPG
jgi:hypothetical protein